MIASYMISPGLKLKLTPDMIVFTKVCKTFNCDPKILLTKEIITTRKREYVVVRQATLSLLVLKLGYSLMKSGDFFEKDHATVIHGIKTMKNIIDTDPNFRDDTEILFKGVTFPDKNNSYKNIKGNLRKKSMDSLVEWWSLD